MLDRIIISCNENYDYLVNWPLVSQAWEKLFGIIPELGLLTKRNINNDLIHKLQEFGQVYLFTPVQGIPTANQSKVLRYFLAGNAGTARCMINDMDLIPLVTYYYNERLAKRREGELLAIGKEVYKHTPHTGKFPAGYCTAEGYVFEKIMNPKRLNWQEYVSQFVGMKQVDGKEDISNHPKAFCDESLMRAMLTHWKGKVCDTEYYPIKEVYKYAVSRHHAINMNRLQDGGYVEAHHLLPIVKCKDRVQAVCQYLDIDFDPEWINEFV